jgi:hypothetical protein
VIDRELTRDISYISHVTRLGFLIFAIAIALSPRLTLAQELATNTYSISTEEFANPERGFYIQADTYASAPSAVPSNLATYRLNGKNSPGNTYTAKISLLLRLFYLDTFVNGPISASFLNSIQADFDSVRAQGSKAIVRFAYNQDQTSPFSEPAKAQILSHIAQLRPLLKQNSDIIAVLQHGFIGAWGEGYYTDIFYTNGQATTQNWLDRADVIDALLDALPTNRMIQVRVPQHKQKYVYGPTAPVTSAPTPGSQAFNGSLHARIGFHNDCFLASSTDFGTYSDYDLGHVTSAPVISSLRNYMSLETRFGPMGGETCAVNPPTDDCSSVGGTADSDMALFHYSFLNESYNTNVNDDWVSQGCMEDIKRRLGYRLQLITGIFRTEAQPGQSISLSLQFQNVGFASPYNPRGMELVLRHSVTGKKYYVELSRDTDLRQWLPGTNQIVNFQISLPSNIPLGSYDLLLNLPDPAPTLYASTAYSIHLANSNAVSSGGALLGSVWEASTAYHNLHQSLSVNAVATNPPPIGTEIPALDFSAIIESYDTWRARNFPTNSAAGAPALDPDGDGRPNLLEYAVGSNPNSAGDPNYFNLTFQTNTLFLSIQKGPGVKDVLYGIESTSNLASGTWAAAPVAVLENSSRLFRVSRNATNSTEYLRLKLSLKTD